MQVFWFRHIFLLSAGDADAVEQLVVQLLADKKLEVQELAARTLSGLIQVCYYFLNDAGGCCCSRASHAANKPCNMNLRPRCS